MQNRKEVEISNLRVLQCYGGMCVILLAAYILEYLKGQRSFGFLSVFCGFLAVPFIISCLFYIKQKSSYYMKELMLIGYAIFYSFILFTSGNFLPRFLLFP